MKGQAFVIYKDLNSATAAKHSLNNAFIFGKPIVKLFNIEGNCRKRCF